jgi:protein arginine kinase activator
LICEDCGKTEAPISYTEMVGSELRTWRLCEECARARGVGVGLTSFAGPLVNILMGLLEDVQEPSEERREEDTACARCGLTYEEFRASGRLGCGDCYDAFGEELLPLLRRVHGSAEHVGRFPPALTEELASRRELVRLKRELDSAIRHEDYESAAELRDGIRELEGGAGVAASATEAADVDV